MTATAPAVEQRGGARVAVQKFGTFLSGMIMPNIPALIAWGIITALFIPDGFTPREDFATLVGPTIHYLLPLLIANTGGRMVYDMRGGVVGTFATMGAILGSDWLIGLINADLPDDNQLGQVHMFIGAMILGPLSAWAMKRLDRLWESKIPSGFEMLVNMFSAGLLSFTMAAFGFYVIAPIVNGIMTVVGGAVGWLVETGLLPLASILIEPAKVFFLNNAINHGVLTPLGLTESAANGQSILFLLEANPGPGTGVLLAYTIFGIGAARATAPGAALIVFGGGIHEVYFPYILMKPALLLAVILGGMTGVATNMLLDTGLRSPAAPGSILAIWAAAPGGSILGVTLSVVLAAAVSFLVAAVILRASRKRDLAREASGDDALGAAISRTEANKGKSSDALSGLRGAGGGVATATLAGPISKIVFACDAGMGSSAMGASVLRNKIRQAGYGDVSVTNIAIANLDATPDVIVTQNELTDRARQRTPDAVHVSVDNFMNSPKYDEVVRLVAESRETAPAQEASAPAAAAAAPVSHGDDVLTLERITVTPTATSKEAAIQEAADALVAAGAVTPAYADAMREREATVSTYMGNLLAIPHGTNEAKGEVLASAISVARYDEPLSWDGNEVRFVVGIAGKDGGHLEILSKLATVFSDEEQVQRLVDAPDEQAILDILGAVNA